MSEIPLTPTATPTPEDLEALQLANKLDAIQMLVETGRLAKAKELDARWGLGYFTKTTKSKKWLDQFITVHPQMIALKELAIKLADPTLTDSVLIIGETGTGKELLAHALHGDRQGNFVEINCAGMPETLIESELFGYERGSFTGAKKEGHIGLIELAGQDDKGNQARGTLFLDEIGELPLQAQAKLLRVLQDKRIRRIGASNDYKAIDFRLICATHCRIKEDNKRFRRDLYYRIATFELETLPLDKRPDDISLIVKSMAPDLFMLEGTKSIQFREWLEKLRGADLKGNVRELQNLVRRYQVLGA